MLYPKSRRLDPGNNTELRMLKMEDQRVNTLSFMANLNKYAMTLEQLSALELKISDDMLKLYTPDSMYGEMAHNLAKALTFKADVVKREVKSLRDSLDRNKNVEAMYNPLRPLIKHYFKSVDNNEHYHQKLPKVMDTMEGKKKMKGNLSDRDTEKIVRNKRKLENAMTDLKVVNEDMFTETNKLNLARFDRINAVAKEFINTEVSLTFLMTEKFGLLDDFDALLAMKENQQFNERYFMDIKKESKSQFMKSSETMRPKSVDQNRQSPVKQNIQNNYYYVNNDENGRSMQKFAPNDVVVGKDSGYYGRPDSSGNNNMTESRYAYNNNQLNAMSYSNPTTPRNALPNQDTSVHHNRSRLGNDNAIALPYN